MSTQLILTTKNDKIRMLEEPYFLRLFDILSFLFSLYPRPGADPGQRSLFVIHSELNQLGLINCHPIKIIVIFWPKYHILYIWYSFPKNLKKYLGHHFNRVKFKQKKKNISLAFNLVWLWLSQQGKTNTFPYLIHFLIYLYICI